MNYDENEDEYTLSTGTRFSANQGIIGINPQIYISEGYDGGINIGFDENEDWRLKEFTTEERKEIAEFMIALWTKFAERGET
jgi:hypothetical protein